MAFCADAFLLPIGECNLLLKVDFRYFFALCNLEQVPQLLDGVSREKPQGGWGFFSVFERG